MRPVVVTTILLLLMLMFMSDSEARYPPGLRMIKYPSIPCQQKISDETWYWLGNNRCVKAFDTQHLVFDDAEKACNKYKFSSFEGHLVSIHNQVEMDQVYCAMYRVHPGKAHYWIGLRRIEDDDNSLGFAWIDDTRTDFTYWAPGQPNNYMLTEECVEMYSWYWGLWNDVSCEQTRSYVCAVRVK